ncbi:hypothetical protein PoB_002588300 [Plakobranchus ocellatus]|uniref:Uncharacterized protein n=1 Tax=Plakobranchus ocellatus TaxID=259542 RepID=A0AAV3ZWZ4_9GAST|nr:hypothetical protein PoB_002588300 [Plakobranchus ocellatus]
MPFSKRAHKSHLLFRCQTKSQSKKETTLGSVNAKKDVGCLMVNAGYPLQCLDSTSRVTGLRILSSDMMVVRVAKVWFLVITSPQQAISGFQALRQVMAPVAGPEPRQKDACRSKGGLASRCATDARLAK